jgi:hypothetical protein
MGRRKQFGGKGKKIGKQPSDAEKPHLTESDGKELSLYQQGQKIKPAYSTKQGGQSGKNRFFCIDFLDECKMQRPDNRQQNE